MDPSAASTPSKVSKKRPRPAYSCVECMRRKLRCSKQIPCSACVERGIEHLCRRRSESNSVAGRISVSTARTTLTVTNNDSCDALAKTPAPWLSSQTSPVTSDGAHTTAPHSTLAQPRQKPLENVTEDAAVMLEFLALNRQRVLQIAQIGQPQLSGRNSNAAPKFDPLFTPNQVRAMMLYH